MAGHTAYLLHLADNALILGQRNAKWCGLGPALEEDIAMANISLDLIGQARLLYQHAAALLSQQPCSQPRPVPTEDTLAYFRDPHEFRNYTLLELPHFPSSTGLLGATAQAAPDYATTIVRNFLYDGLMLLVWHELQGSNDTQLAAIAAKSVKETRYHWRHSRDWLVRMGDGTDHSHARVQAALQQLLPYTEEFWSPSQLEVDAVASGAGVDTARLQTDWDHNLDLALAEADLMRPTGRGFVPQGKNGRHSEHLGYLLEEMQSLARRHPGAVW